MRFLRTLCFLLCVYNVLAYKILGLFPHPGRSHFNVFEPLLKQLRNRGHQITVISHFPQEETLKSWTDIILETKLEVFEKGIPLGLFGHGIWTRLRHPLDIAMVTKDTCCSLNSTNVQEFLKKHEKFDVVLTEHFAGNCYLGIIHVTGGSLVGLQSSNILPWVNDFIGQPDNPSYIPVIFSGSTDKMSFGEKLENVMVYAISKLVYRYFIDIPANRVAKASIDPNLPELNTFAYNTSVVLSNVHHSVHTPRPLVPKLIEIGGMHVAESKSLPKNLEKWINESKEGVVYFSMGSMLIGHSFPEDKREMFLKAFSKLRQRVLWKWENETMPGKPPNVMIQKWMPQLDILCHPNVKAFVSHGGLLGMTEAVHCGVPAIVMPQYGDQFTNARALEASGGGIVLDFASMTEETVYGALLKILKPQFKRQAEELSVRFRDRPMSPMDTAIYWIEYVARHKGAPHLRTAAVGMPLYQYLLLDVLAFFIAVSIAIYYILLYSIKFIFGLIFRSKTKKVKTN